jgi:hypothetical protein
MPNRWVDHVKSFATQNNLSYACALSTPDCKETYRAKYGVSKKLTKKQNIEKMAAEDRNAPNIQLVVKEKKKRRPTLKLEEVMMEDEDNRSKMVATQEKKKKVLASLPKPKIQQEVAMLQPMSSQKQQEQEVFKNIVQSPEIDNLVEETIKDMYYDEFPDFMKNDVFTKEKIYKDKFLRQSIRDQDKIRKKVKAKLLAMVMEGQKPEPAKRNNKQKVGDLEPEEFSVWMFDKTPRMPNKYQSIGYGWKGQKDKFGNWFAYFYSPFREMKLVRPNGEILDFDKDKNDLTKEENKFYEKVFNKMSKMRQKFNLKLVSIENHSNSEIELLRYMYKLN